MILHGVIHVVLVDHFEVALSDDDGVSSVAKIMIADVAEEERPHIVPGNTLAYEFGPGGERLSINPLRTWTQEDVGRFHRERDRRSDQARDHHARDSSDH